MSGSSRSQARARPASKAAGSTRPISAPAPPHRKQAVVPARGSQRPDLHQPLHRARRDRPRHDQPHERTDPRRRPHQQGHPDQTAARHDESRAGDLDPERDQLDVPARARAGRRHRARTQRRFARSLGAAVLARPPRGVREPRSPHRAADHRPRADRLRGAAVAARKPRTGRERLVAMAGDRPQGGAGLPRPLRLSRGRAAARRDRGGPISATRWSCRISSR